MSCQKNENIETKKYNNKKYNHLGTSKTDDTREYPNLLEQDFFCF